ncbi:hypothetical protein KCU65_g5738, partial [Aureobasidium melanogenum]
MTRPKYISAHSFARRKRRESIAKRKRHQARLRLHAVAPRVFSSAELVGFILSHITKESALARLSLVCKLWSEEAARHLWKRCTQLLNLEQKVCPARHGRVASLIHRVHLDPVKQIWSGASEMPEFSNLRILEMNAAPNMLPFESRCMSRLLCPSLQQLRLVNDNFYGRSPVLDDQDVRLGSVSSIQDVRIFDIRNVGPSSASWLSSLHQRCPSLECLLLDLRLTPNARTDFELFLLSSSLKGLYLGDLLHETLDDWSIAIILAHQSLEMLHLCFPITTQSLDILRSQCSGPPILSNLHHLTAEFNVSAERAIASLLPLTPNLTFLDVTLDHTPDGTPWSPDATAFLAIGQLKRLYALHIRIKTSSTGDTGVTGANLLALADLPLTYLFIHGCAAKPHYALLLHEVTGFDLLHVLRRWQSLKTLYLYMVCKEVLGVRAAEHEQEIRTLLN